RLPHPLGRRAADQLPPARVDAADAGVGVRGQGQDLRRLRACGARALPVLLLRGRDAAVSATLKPASRLEVGRANAYNSHLHLRRTDGGCPSHEEFPMSPQTRAPRALRAVIAAACAVLLVACGSDQAPANAAAD